EEECLVLVLVVNVRNVERPADGVPVIVLLIFGHRALEKIARVEGIVADELIDIAVEAAGAGLGLELDRSRPVAAILGTVVGSEDAKFGNGIEAGISVEGGIAAVIHVVAAIDLPIVVFGASAVDAELHVAGQAGPGFIRTGLIADAGSEGG